MLFYTRIEPDFSARELGVFTLNLIVNTIRRREAVDKFNQGEEAINSSQCKVVQISNAWGVCQSWSES